MLTLILKIILMQINSFQSMYKDTRFRDNLIFRISCYIKTQLYRVIKDVFTNVSSVLKTTIYEHTEHVRYLSSGATEATSIYIGRSRGRVRRRTSTSVFVLAILAGPLASFLALFAFILTTPLVILKLNLDVHAVVGPREQALFTLGLGGSFKVRRSLLDIVTLWFLLDIDGRRGRGYYL